MTYTFITKEATPTVVTTGGGGGEGSYLRNYHPFSYAEAKSWQLQLHKDDREVETVVTRRLTTQDTDCYRQGT